MMATLNDGLTLTPNPKATVGAVSESELLGDGNYSQIMAVSNE